jgi:hypothetical protein
VGCPQPLRLVSVEGQRGLHGEGPAGAARDDVAEQVVAQRALLAHQQRVGLGERLARDLLDQRGARLGPAEAEERCEHVDPLLPGVAGRLE